jgi:hydroxyacylglutathione hydrolase
MGEGRLVEHTQALYDSLHQRVLPLGEHVVLCPAHGPGSACGGAIAERPLTTLGLELALNPKLGLGRDEFVRRQAVVQDRPPYFRRMESRNLDPDGLQAVPWPPPLSIGEFAEASGEALVLDTRRPPAFLAGHIAGAVSIWTAGVGSWAGWFLPYDRPILLVAEHGDLDAVRSTLARMGFDDIRGSLQGGMHAWHVDGRESESLGAVSVPEAQRRLQAGNGAHLLDVRTPAEHAEGIAPGAIPIPLSELGDRLGEVPSAGSIYIFCGSGLRSTVAASLLARQGRRDVHVILGGMKGWQAQDAPTERVIQGER